MPKAIYKSKEWKAKISAALTGRVFSISHIAKLSASLMRKPKSEKHKAKISAAKMGKHLSNETKAKLSDFFIGVPKSEKHKVSMRKPKSEKHKVKISASQMGDKNSNWKGGSSSELYPSKFNSKLKIEVKIRDEYRCMICKLSELKLKEISGKGLFIHHIDYNKENCDKSNLLSLCNRCHSTVNGNREYWIGRFKHLISLN